MTAADYYARAEERLEYLFIASGWKSLAEAAERAAGAAEPPEEPKA